MKLDFVKFDPTRNTTVIVSTPLNRAMYASVSAALMDYASLCAEQVGFIEPPTDARAAIRLQMMGGEFCGNAAMCVSVLAARKIGIADNETKDIRFEISGCDGLCNCRVTSSGDDFRCTVDMPLPATIHDSEICPVIRLPGITHGIYECADPNAMRDTAPQILKRLAKIEPADAVGLMLFSKEKGAMLPLVYVRDTDTMVWENGCGSGSAAVGAYMALRYAQGEIAISQPGGIISARAETQNGKVTALSITGNVRITAEGVAYV